MPRAWVADAPDSNEGMRGRRPVTNRTRIRSTKSLKSPSTLIVLCFVVRANSLALLAFSERAIESCICAGASVEYLAFLAA